MIWNRLMAGIGILAAFAMIGLLVMSYVASHWGNVGVAVVVITLFLTFVFITVALIFVAFGLGMMHIVGKALGVGVMTEMLRTIRTADRGKVAQIDSPSEPKLLDWNRDVDYDWKDSSVPGEFTTVSGSDDGFTVR